METVIEKKQVAVLKDLAKFENKPNAVALMKAGGGRVVLVALKRGQKLDEHVAPGDAMVTVVEGRVVFNVEGVDTPINGGEVMFMAKGTPHSVEAVEDTKVLLAIVEP